MYGPASTGKILTILPLQRLLGNYASRFNWCSENHTTALSKNVSINLFTVLYRLRKYSKYTVTFTGRKLVKFCCCLATVHSKSFWVNVIAIAAFVHPLGIQNRSQTTNMTNQRNTVKLLLTLPPVKMKTKSQFSWLRALTVLHTNCCSIESDCDKDFTFHTPVGNIHGHR